MKILLALVLVALVATVMVSGCTQTPATGGGTAKTTASADGQAFNTVDQELDQALEGMTVEDMENELLQQG
ncbi:MAG: hypothetical protein V1648_03425 [Candidatus Aenigmatarchaeota archaeon]